MGWRVAGPSIARLAEQYQIASLFDAQADSRCTAVSSRMGSGGPPGGEYPLSECRVVSLQYFRCMWVLRVVVQHRKAVARRTFAWNGSCNSCHVDYSSRRDAVLELLVHEDQALLVLRDALLVLNLGLHVFNRVARLDLKLECVPSSFRSSALYVLTEM